MKIPRKISDDLGLVLNEASLLEIILNEEENCLLIKFELLRESGSENPNLLNLKLENIKRYIGAYKADVQNSNKVLEFHPQQISKYLDKFFNKDIYGWEFFNVENNNLIFDSLSFDYIKGEDYKNFDSLEVFQEDLNHDLNLKIWFEDFRFFNEYNDELEIECLIERQDKIWKNIFKI